MNLEDHIINELKLPQGWLVRQGGDIICLAAILLLWQIMTLGEAAVEGKGVEGGGEGGGYSARGRYK